MGDFAAAPSSGRDVCFSRRPSSAVDTTNESAERIGYRSDSSLALTCGNRFRGRRQNRSMGQRSSLCRPDRRFLFSARPRSFNPWRAGSHRVSADHRGLSARSRNDSIRAVKRTPSRCTGIDSRDCAVTRNVGNSGICNGFLLRCKLPVSGESAEFSIRDSVVFVPRSAGYAVASQRSSSAFVHPYKNSGRSRPPRSAGRSRWFACKLAPCSRCFATEDSRTVRQHHGYGKSRPGQFSAARCRVLRVPPRSATGGTRSCQAPARSAADPPGFPYPAGAGAWPAVDLAR